jgi:hypothetical protein
MRYFGATCYGDLGAGQPGHRINRAPCSVLRGVRPLKNKHGCGSEKHFIFLFIVGDSGTAPQLQ